MADAADSKSAEGDFVRVQVPPPALFFCLKIRKLSINAEQTSLLKHIDSFFNVFI